MAEERKRDLKERRGGRCDDIELVVPFGPILRAGTSVVGIGCGSIAAFFGDLGGGLRTFPLGAVKKSTLAWGRITISVRYYEHQKHLPRSSDHVPVRQLLFPSMFCRCAQV
jgi:hypothetical protein